MEKYVDIDKERELLKRIEYIESEEEPIEPSSFGPCIPLVSVALSCIWKEDTPSIVACVGIFLYKTFGNYAS